MSALSFILFLGKGHPDKKYNQSLGCEKSKIHFKNHVIGLSDLNLVTTTTAVTEQWTYTVTTSEIEVATTIT